MLTIVVVLYRH